MSFGRPGNFPFDEGMFRDNFRDMEREMARVNEHMRFMEQSIMSNIPFYPPPQVPRPRPNNQPIVEEVDDDDNSIEVESPTEQQWNTADMNMGFGFDGMGYMGHFGGPQMSTQVYSYSSSSRTGPRGQTYSTSNTTRTGPGGVRESYHTVEDGRRGTSTVTVERGIGDRSRRITRTRYRHGEEEARDLLTNIDTTETARFDEDWSRAQHSLPQTRTYHRRLQ